MKNPPFDAHIRLRKRASQRRLTRLFQFRVLRFRSDENRNVRVGIFPEREEILIGRLSFGGIALHGVGAGQASWSRKLGESFLVQKIEVGVSDGSCIYDG